MTMPAATWELIDSLTPWDKNPRHNEKAIEHVAISIERFGFASPIIARESDRVVIAGHTRLAAAKKMGMDKVPVRFMKLDPAESAALALADNKLGELAEWDDELLAQVLQEVEAAEASISDLGWSQAELDALLDDVVVEFDEKEGEPLDPDLNVARERTAPTRDGLSVPFQVLCRLGYITPEKSFLDYGCGKGGDAKAALAMGVKTAAFDPGHRPTPPTPADVVNLAFVLNVIEDPAERAEVLQKAFALAGEILAVGFVGGGMAKAIDGRGASTKYSDGFLTSRGTFQWQFTPADAKAFIDEHLDAEVEWIGKTAFAFANPSAGADFRRRYKRDQQPLNSLLRSLP